MTEKISRNVKEIIDESASNPDSGKLMPREDIITLLSLNPESVEAAYLREKAKEAALKVTGGKAYLWGAMGIDFVPCSMNCRFCSFGEEWSIITESRIYSMDEILSQMQAYIDSGVHYIVMRTTEFYSIDDLCSKVKYIKTHISGDYELILNIGEFGDEEALKMSQAGVDGIYHAVRLREGIDTGFNPDIRNATMAAVHNSPLKLISLVEPVGVEHTNEEIADNLYNIAGHGAAISGSMARIPVPGTPLGDAYPVLSDERISQIIAVIRLACGNLIPDICVHPASELALNSGANVTVIETGAVPRDGKPVDGEWRKFTVEDAMEAFSTAGYTVIRN